MVHNKIKAGLRDGIPIAAGYFSVSFTFGMLAVQDGMSPFHAVLISLLNLTSAGQFAGLTVIVSGASLLEMALTQLVINIRYALMSVSLSQKLDSSVKIFQRMLIAYGNTDEIFAVASSKPGSVGSRYMYGLIFLPVLGWVGGTLTGAVASTLLPAAVISALGVALYGMFIAIVVPVAKESREVLIVVGAALVFSTAFYYLPVLQEISSGFTIIICTVAAAGIGAVLFPVKEETV
ncbi:MAG TPA: AzlC family ABC transporter permease [Candidatus Blautia stercorigallinarum]|uniref:AzlC family ABC transporter permease n=1 Tax=Candidatus Blautia stercorigallinarum TaxID=2838501 RepID=A0A9D1TEN3_9FIRM|nr:AzlC family ABC transporter permease [Candidatus Blautia stercorigallinarum]